MNTNTDKDGDAAAIAACIRAETVAFAAGDYDRWADCFVQEARTCSVNQSTEIGINVHRGWEALSDQMRRTMAQGANCKIRHFTNEDMSIQRAGPLAWVVYEQVLDHGDGSIDRTFETRILEKADGTWRIVYAAFFARKPVVAERGQLALNATGHVIGGDAEARAALLNHPALTVSAGRLRANRPIWDKPLQAAIRRAGELHSYFVQQSFASRHGGPLRIPVILGEDDSGQSVICLLSVRDGVTHLETDTRAMAERHLAAARAVFGLSDGQARLAERIIAGEGPTEAAGNLGISANTARTHLARIYEKTGVNSQTALVRLILSI